MARTFTETVGMIQSVIAYMQDAENQAALTAKSFDVTPHITRLQGKLDAMNQLNADQEQRKVSLVNKTAEVEAALENGDVDTSGIIDAMAGLLGKNTTEAKNLLRIRSDIRQGPQSPPPP